VTALVFRQKRRSCLALRIMLAGAAALLLAVGGRIASPALARSAMTSLGVSLTIIDRCQVASVPNAVSTWNSAIRAGTIAVTCTDTTPYQVRFDRNVADIGMSDTLHTTEIVAGTGDGRAQTLTFHGRIAPESGPASNPLANVVTVTVTF
jgi:spore coat protein U-like protein